MQNKVYSFISAPPDGTQEPMSEMFGVTGTITAFTIVSQETPLPTPSG